MSTATISTGLAFRTSRPGAWRAVTLAAGTMDAFALIRRVIDATLAERERDLVQKLADARAHLAVLS